MSGGSAAVGRRGRSGSASCRQMRAGLTRTDRPLEMPVRFKADAAEVVGHEPIGRAAADQVFGRHGAGAVDEAADDGAAGVELGDRAELPLIEPPVRDRAVDRATDAAVASIDDVFHGGAVRQMHGEQVALHVIGQCRRAAAIRPAADLAVRGVRVDALAEGEDAILIVIRGGARAGAGGDGSAIAVGGAGVCALSGMTYGD